MRQTNCKYTALDQYEQACFQSSLKQLIDALNSFAERVKEKQKTQQHK